MIKPIASVFFFIVLLQWGGAQAILKFDHLTIENGLSNSRVRSFLQDQYGFIWIGTASGLNRYDGYELVNYHSDRDDSNSLQHNGVPALLEDSKGHFWIGTKGGLQLMDRSKNTFYPATDWVENPLQLIGHVIVLKEGENGDIWVGAVNGLFRIRLDEPIPNAAAFKAISKRPGLNVEVFRPWPQGEGNSNWIWSLSEDKLGHMWVGTNRGITKFNSQTNQFEVPIFPNIEQASSLYTSAIHDIECTKAGQLWIGSEDGLFLITDDLKKCHEFTLDPANPNGLHNEFITEIEEDEYGYIWIGSDGGGLTKWDPVEKRFTHYKNALSDPNSLSDNNIEALYIDQKGDLWIGNHKGISYLNHYRKPFRIIRAGVKTNQLSQGTIESIFSSIDGTLWLGIDDGGLNQYYPKADVFTQYRFSSSQQSGLLNDDVVTLIEDQQKRLWIGSWGGGLSWRYADGRFYHFMKDETRAAPLRDAFIWTLFKDQQGDIWIGTVNNGLIQYQQGLQQFVFHGKGAEAKNRIQGTWVISIEQDKQQNIWIYTNAGLYRYQKATQKIDTFDLAFLGKEERISAICPNDDGSLWLGTEKGLVHFYPDQKEYTIIDLGEDISNKWVRSIQKDQKGNLWLGIGRTLSKFDPKSRQLIHHEIKDGLTVGEFTRASAISEDGYIYMGNIEGLVVFQPDSIRTYPTAPKTVITDFLLFNESVPLASTKADTMPTPSPLKLAPFISQKLHLDHWQNDIAFEFAALDYLNPDKNKYQYRLKGMQENWIDASAQIRLASYTNLSPGNYQFQVRAANPDGIWSQEVAKMDIQIAYPWWRAWWAYMIYFFILVLIIYIGIFYLKKRMELQAQLSQKQLEADRLKELDNFKGKLYTNLTHEFRTPLTVILGMVQQIKAAPNKYLEQGLPLIESNGKNLLRLINQLLDLSKLENNALHLNLIQGDIVPYLSYLTASLKTVADHKNIDLGFYTEEPSVLMDYDPEQLKHIVYNLLSNAIKFTPANGKVNLNVSSASNQLFIQVQDSGIGMTPEELNHIFDRFYQADNELTREVEGTGIGLAYTRELVKLMQGEIKAVSQVGKGTTISVVIPITQNASPIQQNHTLAISSSGITSSAKANNPVSNDLPLVLIVEDNPDVVFYIKSCLDEHYQVEMAYDGQAGIDLALEKIPDLIISDVMMPEKDGFMVCDTLKNDERTSHIPIILLTAKADVGSRIKGLRRGADAYLAKPFDEEELLVRIEQLVEKQERIAKYFHAQQHSHETPATPDTLDKEAIQIEDTFLQKVNDIISKHYHQEEFALPELCQMIGMSRSQLYRKMKAIADTSPSAFIRNYRLAEAKKLLERGEHTVSEVAWKVGFKDLAHFSKSFLSNFGRSPSDFLKG